MNRILLALGTLLGTFAFAGIAHAQNYVKDGFGKCLHIPEESRNNGIHLRTWACSDKAHIKWERVPLLMDFNSAAGDAGLQYFWLKNNMTGKCAAVHKGRHHDGSAVVQWDCESSIHFQWAELGNTGQIVHRESKKCMHSASGSNYAPVTIRTCAGIHPPKGGQWNYERRPETTRPGALTPSTTASFLKNGFGYCLHVPHESYTDGTQLMTWDCTDLNQILWVNEGVMDFSGFLMYKNRMTGKCMAVHAGQKQDGAKVIQWSCGGIQLGHNFHWQPRGDQLMHRESGKCLHVASGGIRVLATLGPCTELQVASNLKWTVGK